jgi:hypothetical protein
MTQTIKINHIRRFQAFAFKANDKNVDNISLVRTAYLLYNIIITVKDCITFCHKYRVEQRRLCPKEMFQLQLASNFELHQLAVIMTYSANVENATVSLLL